MNDSSPNQDGMPRWVKGFVIVGVVIAVLFVVLLVFGPGPGNHGPGRHTAGAASTSLVPGGHSPPAGIPDHGGRWSW